MKAKFFEAVVLKGKLAGKTGMATPMNIYGNVLFFCNEAECWLKVTDICYID
jgi:hypothetical protein